MFLLPPNLPLMIDHPDKILPRTCFPPLSSSSHSDITPHHDEDNSSYAPHSPTPSPSTSPPPIDIPSSPSPPPNPPLSGFWLNKTQRTTTPSASLSWVPLPSRPSTLSMKEGLTLMSLEPWVLRPSARRSRSRILVSEGICVRASHISIDSACRVSKWTKSRRLA